jgi:hypothetical protein
MSVKFTEDAAKRLVRGVRIVERADTGRDSRRRRSVSVGPREIDALITGHSQDGTNKRWLYAWSQAKKTTAGYGGWTAVTGGLSGTTTSKIAYNRVENINAATGTFGNGVASTNLTGTFDVQPVPSGTPVRLKRVVVAGVTEFWFSYESGIDGACS